MLWDYSTYCVGGVEQDATLGSNRKIFFHTQGYCLKSGLRIVSQDTLKRVVKRQYHKIKFTKQDSDSRK